MFYFENTPDPADVKALAEAEGVKIDNLKKLKELQDMNGIDRKTYQDAVNKYKSEKSKHAAGMRSLPNRFSRIADREPLLAKSEPHICTHIDCDHPSHFIDDRAATISPDGSDKPLPAVPSDFAVNSAHLDAAIELFEETFPDYKDLLNARVTGMAQTDAIESVRQGDWVYDDLKKIYRNSKTKKRLAAEDLLEIRNDFIDAQRLTFSESRAAFDERSIVSALVSGLKTVQEWLYEMRQKVRDIFNAQYMLGRGGRNAMFQSDLDSQTDAIASQFDFLQAFAEQVRQGELSAKQIAARAELYMEASTSVFEEGKASSHGITLPEYPGDGNQICGVRCRCTWILVPSKDRVNAFWTLNPLAKHCESCRENAAKWAPYVVKISGQ